MLHLGLELAVICLKGSFSTCFDKLLKFCVNSWKACMQCGVLLFHDNIGITSKGKKEHAGAIATLHRHRIIYHADSHIMCLLA